MPAAKAKTRTPKPPPQVKAVVKREITLPVIATIDRYGEERKAQGQTVIAEQKNGQLTLKAKEVGLGLVISDTALGEVVELLKEKL